MAIVLQLDPLCTHQIGGCTELLREAPSHPIVGSQQMEYNQASRCSSAMNPALPTKEGFPSHGRRQKQEQELLWREFFLDPTVWWDNRRHKKGSRSPDFRRKGSGEVLWLNSIFKPAWVDEQLVSWDVQMDHGASPSKWSSPDKPEAGRRAGPETGFLTAETVSKLCQQGNLTEAFGALESLAQTDCPISVSLLYTVLKVCAAKKNLVVGRRVHDLCVKLGHESNTYLGNHVLRMYAYGGRLQEAMDVFTRVGKPDAFMWGSMLSAYAKHGKHREAIELYHEVHSSGLKADAHVFVAALQACALAADLESGRKVHCDVLDSGIPPNVFVGTCLVDMYAKCGVLRDARGVFDSLATKDVVTWTALIAGYAQQGLGREALVLHEQMEQEGLIVADQVTFTCLLKACASTGALQKGRQLHLQIVERGLVDNILVGTCLVDMYAKCGEVADAHRVFDSLTTKDAVTWTALIAGYAKCGELEEARRVFDRLATKNVVTWNALIAGYAQQGLGQEALVLYGQMEQEDLIVADPVTFACLLKACASAGALQKGKQLHSQIVKRGLLDNVLVGTSLVDMYAKCGELEEGRRVFDRLATKDVVTWTALIGGYAQQGLGQDALVLYGQMEQEGLIVADHVTFSCLLKACSSSGALQKGRQLHSQIVERGLLDNILVGTCLVDMYAKCGELEEGRRVFDSLATKSLPTWNALIAGYAQEGLSQEALVLYAQMEQEGLIVADHVTFACLLKACASIRALQKGKQLHSQIVERGLLDNVLVGTCLVDMYAKCGELEDARRVFDRMSTKDMVTWNALIAGYAKCGELEAARQVFDSLATKDVVTWNALIAGYSQQGLGQEALVLYGEMEQEGLSVADDVTFACLLKSCTSAGALQMGRQLHSQIVDRGLLNNILVGTCLVDMYAKCGELEEARRVFDSLATNDVVSWNALIFGCGACNEGHKALACFEEMLVAGVQPDDATFTCLLAACSHEGLVDEGRKHFSSMVEQHGIKPTVEHYTCMVDLLGRAGRLDEAENMLLSCEGQSNVVGLRSLLNACKNHGDLERATRCFESLVRLEPQQASAYVLMANAFADAGMWSDVDRIETQRLAAGANKKPAVAGIEVKKQVHTFVVGESREEIVLKVESMNARLKQEGGHIPHTKLVLKPVSEKEKEDALCGHAEKLALAYGLLNTPSGTPLLVTKNLRMCSDCHSSTEIMSRVEKRDIVVRDGYRVHRFVAGSCSCEGRP